MAIGIININSDEFVKLSDKLEKIGMADLPIAVRSTLNNMAFRMKGSGGQRGMIDISGEKEFDYRRNRTLLKAMTGVNKADGLDIRKMQSQAGIIKRSGMDQVAEGLEDQEKGGKTEQKATPLTRTRTGNNLGRKVRRKSYLKNIDALDLRSKRGNKYIAAAIRAKKQNRTILIKGRGGTTLIGRVKSIRRQKGTVKFKTDWLYRINDNGYIKLKKKRPFVTDAAKEVMKTGAQEFVKQAEKRLNKIK